MNIEPRITIPFILAVFAVAACNEAKPSKHEAIERAKPSQPMLTSTAPAPASATATPVEEKKPKPFPADVVKEALAEEKAPDQFPSEEPQAFEPELGSLDGVSIQRLVTAPEVKRREPIAATSVFGHHDERVYAFVEVSNDSDEDRALLVHFIGPDGQVSGGIELRIPAASPRWRTWAYTRNATTPGLWRVEIRTVDGTLVGALPFEVEEGC